MYNYNLIIPQGGKFLLYIAQILEVLKYKQLWLFTVIIGGRVLKDINSRHLWNSLLKDVEI